VSFRARLVLAAAYLLTAVVLALEIPLALNVERRATSEFQSAVLGNAAVLAARMSDLVAEAGARPRASAEQRRRVGEIAREATVGQSGRIVVADSRGRVLADTAGSARAGEPYATRERPELGVALFQGRIDVRRRVSETLDEELLLVTVPIVDREQVVGAVRVSAPTGEVRAGVRESWLRLGLIGLAVVAAGLGLAWLLAGSVARPLGRLGAVAARLGRGELDARVSPEGPRELAAVGRSFNQMAHALASSLAAQRDFIANASHQLRTPLTGIKLRLEAIRGEGGAVAVQAAEAESELDRLSSLVDDLLELARASSPETTGRSIDVAEVARAAVGRWAEPAASSGHELELGRQTSAFVWADTADLGHLLDNLIENALRYCPPGTTITVEANAEDGRAALAVADTGPGIPPDDRSRVFERFYRGANGRRAGAGTGLGLAIVAELADRWQGTIRLVDGPGTRVEAVFPRLPAKR
jgi:two-component system, OmpR family, sensor kinase